MKTSDTKEQHLAKLANLSEWLAKESERYRKLAEIQDDRYILGIYQGKAESYRLLSKLVGSVAEWAEDVCWNTDDIELLMFCCDCGTYDQVKLREDPDQGISLPRCYGCQVSQVTELRIK